MSSCLNCEHLGKVYVFSTNSLTFTEAQRYCEINRGALAKDLDSSALTKLLECCPGRSFYWIGLKSVAASKCINRNSFGLQWIGSRTCSDGKSLGLNLQPVNNNECKAIKMRMRSSNINKPKAAVEFCHESIKYICQTNKARTTRATTTTTTNHITRFTETSRKIRALNSMTKIKNKQSDVNEISDILSFKNRISTISSKNLFLKNCKGLTDSYSSHIGASIGGAVGFNVLIFLLLIALFCYKKKKLEKKHKNQTFVSSGVSYDQTHGSVYWSIEEKQCGENQTNFIKNQVDPKNNSEQRTSVKFLEKSSKEINPYEITILDEGNTPKSPDSNYFIKPFN